MVLVFGRTWCSWACPFGFVQELFSDARELLRLPSLRLGYPVRAFLRKTKYALIFATILITVPLGIATLGLSSCVSTLSLPFCQVCPAKGFFTLLQQIVGLEPWTTQLPLVAVISLGTFIAFSAVMRMPFCRICPMGGTMALLASYSLIYLKKDADKCTKCRVCLRVCPLDHDRVYEEMGRIDVGGEDCTLCGRCVEFCPEEGCLSLSAGPVDVFTSRKPRPVGIINRIKRLKNGKGGSSGQ
jgi:polyferredoxin